MTGKFPSSLVITGGSRGIGRAVAEAALARGCRKLLLLGREKGRAQLAANSLTESYRNAEIYAEGADVGDEEALQKALGRGFEALGSVPEALVAAAGVVRPQLFQRSRSEDLAATLQTNLLGAMHSSQVYLRHATQARTPAQIVLLGSVVGSGYTRQGGQTAYAASKAGLVGFTRALAVEYGSRNVRVNMVSPGFIDTDMTATLPEPMKAKVLADTPLGRFGEPRDVAEAVCYFFQASFTTGSILVVDGGLSL